MEGDAVPTIFDHAPRKRICLIEKSGKTAKIQIIEEALVEHETEILSKQTEVCCSTEDLIVVKDASIQMKQKSYKSIRTRHVLVMSYNVFKFISYMLSTSKNLQNIRQRDYGYCGYCL